MYRARFADGRDAYNREADGRKAGTKAIRRNRHLAAFVRQAEVDRSRCASVLRQREPSGRTMGPLEASSDAIRSGIVQRRSGTSPDELRAEESGTLRHGSRRG